ncbi:MazG nucleotide pyrophosphohydrolase domain-containing protein [Thiolapillus sp.]|uniref:MazG nucleotide pyrophosphohydrolase domain-containing protein n=1 Tax=Thiolapillus sp. TaxID=2017437 RepID=UPI003AF838DB
MQQHIEVKMNIFNETNELAEKIANLLNREGIESELGDVLVYVLEEADKHLMTWLEERIDN